MEIRPDKKGRGRPRQYLQLDEWEEWKTNDWFHMVVDVKFLKLTSLRIILPLAITIEATLIAALVILIIRG